MMLASRVRVPFVIEARLYVAYRDDVEERYAFSCADEAWDYYRLWEQ